jgi:hypothetical protein
MEATEQPSSGRGQRGVAGGSEPETALPESREPLRRARRRSCWDRAKKSGQRSESGRVGSLLPVKYGSSCGPGVAASVRTAAACRTEGEEQRGGGTLVGVGSSGSTPFSSTDGISRKTVVF